MNIKFSYILEEYLETVFFLSLKLWMTATILSPSYLSLSTLTLNTYQPMSKLTSTISLPHTKLSIASCQIWLFSNSYWTAHRTRYFYQLLKTTNFLGITVDEHLTWKQHISKTNTKLSRSFGVLCRLTRFLPSFTLKTLYNTLFVSHLQHGILLWGNSSCVRPLLKGS